MPKALQNIPDLTKFSNYTAFKLCYPNFKMCKSAFSTKKNLQLRSIITAEVKEALEHKTSSEKFEKEPLNQADKQEIIEISIASVKKHAPTQWQCAMTALERLLPQHFAKRDGNTPLTNAIGIRITIGAREQQAQDPSVEVVQSVPLSNNQGVDNSNAPLNE